jgi:plasmid stabilization system protein ParE
LAQISYSDEALSDLQRLIEFAEEAGAEVAALIIEAVSLLEHHPFVGRPAEHGLRELVISRGRTGSVALYRFLEQEEVVLVLAVRHQKEQGWGETQGA